MKLLVRWILNTAALLAVAWVMAGHGVYLAGFGAALRAALLLGIINALIRPAVILLTLPINILTLGLFTLFINAACFSLTAWFIDGFEVTGLWGAFFGALLMTILSAMLSAGIKKE
jgi:putative membrane protein